MDRHTTKVAQETIAASKSSRSSLEYHHSPIMRQLKRYFRYEFWPFWVFYFPAYFYWAFLAIRARFTTYFTAANPLMNNSGALNTSKYAYLSKLPPAWYPKTLLIQQSMPIEEINRCLEKQHFSYPLILKPDNGERGKGIAVLNNSKELIQSLEKSKHAHLLLQSFSHYPNEIAFLYSRMPNQKHGKISSITTKSFCTLEGDGHSTWEELLKQNIRVSHRWQSLKKREKLPWNQIATKGDKYLIEPIGSHHLVTQFNNGAALHSAELVQLLDHWANQLPGFYYGRFDVKYKNWEALLKGKDFHLMEINGVNAEPTHIYNPSNPIIKAYATIVYHMKIIYEISNQNRRLGIKPKPLKPFLTELIQTALR